MSAHVWHDITQLDYHHEGVALPELLLVATFPAQMTGNPAFFDSLPGGPVFRHNPSLAASRAATSWRILGFLRVPFRYGRCRVSFFYLPGGRGSSTHRVGHPALLDSLQGCPVFWTQFKASSFPSCYIQVHLRFAVWALSLRMLPGIGFLFARRERVIHPHGRSSLFSSTETDTTSSSDVLRLQATRAAQPNDALCDRSVFALLRILLLPLPMLPLLSLLLLLCGRAS